jgi:hypothetical protein
VICSLTWVDDLRTRTGFRAAEYNTIAASVLKLDDFLRHRVLSAFGADGRAVENISVKDLVKEYAYKLGGVHTQLLQDSTRNS